MKKLYADETQLHGWLSNDCDHQCEAVYLCTEVEAHLAALQAQHAEALAEMQKQSERYQKLVAFFTNEDFNQAMEVRSFYYDCGNTRERFEKAVDALP